ncbi:MAG: carbohydrate porin [Hyphomicrobiales bacterium]|nr:carbohydrate porin [Hyphomicrobiales bacterium]
MPPGFWNQGTLLGQLGGLRPWLKNHGVTFGLSESDEVMDNVSGGIRRGPVYDGLAEATLMIDTAKAFGWQGGTLNASLLQIHGHSISTDHLLALHTASNIEASQATRLWELWFDQQIFSPDLDLKIGQQSVDQEFVAPHYAAVFLNATLGWPVIPTNDLYAGGPAYPLSSPGVRLRARLGANVTALIGVFDDNPPGGPFAQDSQVRGAEATGARFNLGTGALWMAELQIRHNLKPASTCTSLICGLPGAVKLGLMADTGAFPDQRFGTDGLSLANPASNGMARPHNGNVIPYAIASQMLWRDKADHQRHLGGFVRVMAAPGDRNLVDFSVDAGLDLQSPFEGRAHDHLALGASYAHISARARALNADTARFAGKTYPLRSSESLIEATYLAQINPWWVVQPDVQYIFRPGGGINVAGIGSARLGNEMIVGLRSVVTFQ